MTIKYRHVKRITDIFVATFLLLVLSPFILLAALGVRFRLGEPVLFKQLRPGLHEKPFILYKLRTMKEVTDSSGNLLSDEERLTPFGEKLRKYSIDEIPQLFNVLKGDLSLVGPRPLLMEYLPLYTQEQRRRHHVKPGMTGWAQVNGRNNNTWEESFTLDLYYVDHVSFLLDLKILLLTIPKAFKSEGINHPGHATRELFKGEENDRDEDT